MDFFPVVLFLPFFHLRFVVRRMRCKDEFRSGSLPQVANGTAEAFARMRAVGTTKKVWMRVRLERRTERARGQLLVLNCVVIVGGPTLFGYRVDTLVTCRAAIETRNTLETVMNWQFTQHDLLYLYGR